MAYKKKKYPFNGRKITQRSGKLSGTQRNLIARLQILLFRTTYSLRDICASLIKENEKTLCMRN